MTQRDLTPTHVLPAWPDRTGPRAVVRRGAMGEDIGEAELLQALQRGEGWGAVQLYERLHEPVSRTLARLLRRSGEQLEDLVQTSFERMIRFLIHNSSTSAATCAAGRARWRPTSRSITARA
jgi:hypothetical protein